MNTGTVWCAQRAPVPAPTARPGRRHPFLRVLRALVMVVVVVVTVLFSAMALLPSLGMRTMVVLSGSMSPTFETGDAVVVAHTDPETVHIGDVITFAGYGTDRLTTHRVIDVTAVDGELHFRTQGDANPDPDPNLAPAGGLQGTVRFALPHMGRVLAPMLTRTGKLAILGLPAMLLVAGQLRTLLRTVLARSGRAGWTPRVALASVVIVLAAAVTGVTIAHTLATFSDAVQAADNSFRTGTFGSE